jgi:hypothetical protein
MKLTKNVLAWAAILSASLAAAADQPLARLSVRSYTDLTNAISRLATAINPSQAQDPVLQFSLAMGLTNLATLDTQRPWEIALWHGGTAELPLLAVKVPARNVAKFKDALSPGGMLRSKAQDWLQLTNDTSLILFSKPDSLSDSQKSALEEWKLQPMTPPAPLVELKLSLNEPLRLQALGMLPIGKMSAAQALASRSAQTPNAFNPAAIEGMVSVFFDTVQTVVAGLQDVTLGIDLSSDALIVQKSVSAKPGTDLAKWLQKPAGQVTAQDLNWAASDSSVSFAAFFGKDPALLKLAQKMIQLGFQMQNVETNGPAAKDLDLLMAKCLPVILAGSMDFKDTFAFAGAYRFPGSKVADTYAEIRRFLTNSFQGFVGEGKMYSAASLLEKHHMLNGIQVDRFTMTINADFPLFKAPGQKEQLALMWPNGKMEIDYAIKDDHLLIATRDRMNELLRPPGADSIRKPAFKPGEGTLLAGSINLLALVGPMSAANPAIPDGVKERLAKLDAQGTGIEFQVRADQQLFASARIPLKLLRELGRLKGD